MLHRDDILARKRALYADRRYSSVPRGVKLELIEDPSDLWIVGHRFGSGQIRHDMAANVSIWMSGTRFRTAGGTIVEVRRGKLWANEREWRGDLK